MRGNNRMRYCSMCNLKVYNFRYFKEAEIRETLQRNTGRICGRIYRRLDGTIMTNDCQQQHVNRRACRVVTVILSLWIIIFFALLTPRSEGLLPDPIREYLEEKGVLESSTTTFVGVIACPAPPPSPGPTVTK